MQQTKYYFAQFGFNLIELLVAISIAAIIAGASIPSFASLIVRNQVTAQTNALFESLYLARSYAIAQQKNVHICHIDKTTSMACSEQRTYNSTWSAGWLVFVDINANNNYDKGDNLVRAIQTNGQTNIVFNQRGRLRFFPDGSARSAGFYVCDKQRKNYRHVFLLYSGRARVNRDLSDIQKAHCDAV